MNEEKKLILDMLKEGKISVDEAENLLEFVEKKPREPTLAKSENRKFFKVMVTEGDSTKVNVRIPLALAEVGLKLVPKDKLKIEGKQIDLDEILKLIKEGQEGEFVNIETMDKGKEVKVKIFVD